jgi:universal stress protein E
MEQFKSILVCIQHVELPQRPALDRACRLARRTGAAVKIVTVEEERSSILLRALPELAEAGGLIRRERADILRQLVAELRSQGLDVRASFRKGRPHVEIIREALAGGHDLVIATARGKDGHGLTYFGSTVRKLLRYCPVPVWVVPPGPARFRKILAAVDAYSPDEEHGVLNGKVIDLALSLAEIDDAQVRVLQAWEFFGASILRSKLERTAPA